MFTALRTGSLLLIRLEVQWNRPKVSKGNTSSKTKYDIEPLLENRGFLLDK